MRFFRAVSVVLLLLLGPTLAFSPAALDALLIHAHDHHDLHAHAIAFSGNRDARDTHDDHDGHDHHGDSPASSLPADQDGSEFVLVFSKILVPSSGAPFRALVGSDRPVPPWLVPLVFESAPKQSRLPFATGPPPSACHYPPDKTAALLLYNHALLL